ncbi:UNVERIFIED_CONTAM: CCR4-NOT transcription complex subunit, partial [Sesamum calycinum]
MANLPPPLNLKAAPFEVPSSSSFGAGKERKMQSAEQLVLDLCNPDLRENALLELSKKRELFQDLAPLLWNSFGTIAALLQEIVSIYPVLSPPNLTPAQSNRVCNALALLQCVASHPDTRMLFLNAHIPLYLYPFLNTTSKSRPFEYLRLTSLGVIGALVKVDDTEVISFLLSTEIIPLCLRTMEMGSELSKTVATFIVQKILLDDVGLEYICTTAERFFAVGRVLGNMVAALAEQPSSRLLKHIIRCYLRLSDNPRACDALRSCLPDMLRDATFSSCLRVGGSNHKKVLQQLLHNVQGPRVALQAGGGFDHMMDHQLSGNIVGDYALFPVLNSNNGLSWIDDEVEPYIALRVVESPVSSPTVKYTYTLPSEDEEISDMEASVMAVEKILKYSFKNKKLLEEALTHSSCTGSSSYQRLEFVGDAALGLALANYVFLQYPDLDPGKLSRSDASASACWEAKPTFPLEFYQNRVPFMVLFQVREFVMTVEQEDEAEVYGGLVKAPKVLADIVESVAAAVYVDCNFNLKSM